MSPSHALVQVTFFLAMAVSGRLGTATLAAHQVVAQLWLLTSYVVDGFAVAGTVLGSRLAPVGPGAQSKDPRRVSNKNMSHMTLSVEHTRQGHITNALLLVLNVALPPKNAVRSGCHSTRRVFTQFQAPR